jgi:hypothetical protein
LVKKQRDESVETLILGNNSENILDTRAVFNFSGMGGINHAYDDGQYLHVFYTEIKGSVELSMYDVHFRNIQLGGIFIEGTTSKHMTVKKEALTPGIYFIQLSNSSQTFSYKLYVR